MVLSCLIVDDEPHAVLLLQSYIERLPYLKLEKACYDGVEALGYLRDHTVDVIFLDINLPLLSGLELTGVLPKTSKIIFTTAYSEYAVESYEKSAVDYLLKPITFVRFTTAVEKVMEAWQTTSNSAPSVETDQWLFIKSGVELVRLSFDDIVFIKGEREYISLHTEQANHLIYKRMKEIEEQLPPYFMRVHQSYIVNMQKIKRMVQYKVEMGKDWIPVSQPYRSALLKAIERRLI